MNVLRIGSALSAIVVAVSAAAMGETLDKRICACCDCTCAGEYIPCPIVGELSHSPSS